MNRRGFIDVLIKGAAAAAVGVSLPLQAPAEESLEALQFIDDPDPIRGFLDENGNFVQVSRWLLYATFSGEAWFQNPRWVDAPLEIRVATRKEELVCVAFPNPKKS